MNSESRAVAAFAVVAVVLVTIAWLLSHGLTPEGGVAALPNLPPPVETAPAGSAVAGQAPSVHPPLLLQDPSVSRTRIAFAFAGEIWTAPRAGGQATRLVSAQLRNARPLFSPDGSQIAFTGIDDANAAVYVVSAEGG
jgi:hypothetical protein